VKLKRTAGSPALTETTAVRPVPGPANGGGTRRNPLKRFIWPTELISPSVPSASPAVPLPSAGRRSGSPGVQIVSSARPCASASCGVVRILPSGRKSRDHSERLEPLIRQAKSSERRLPKARRPRPSAASGARPPSRLEMPWQTLSRSNGPILQGGSGREGEFGARIFLLDRLQPIARPAAKRRQGEA
jgi:hypothetical protein